MSTNGAGGGAAAAAATAAAAPLRFESYTRTPSKGLFFKTLRNVGLTANDRLIPKFGEYNIGVLERLGEKGVFGRYYHLYKTYITKGKNGMNPATLDAFEYTENARKQMFESLKLATPPSELDFSPIRRQIESIRDLNPDLRSELSTFVYLIEIMYELEASKIRKQKQRGGSENNNRKSGYASLTQYKATLWDTTIHVYKIDLHKKSRCETMKLTRLKDRVKKYAVNALRLGKYTRKVRQAQLPKNDMFVPTLLKYLDPDGIYTYCFNNDGTLMIAETAHNSLTKELLSKHVLLCSKTPCASGELRFVGNTMVFDDDSGTYRPGGKQLESLRHALPFADIDLKLIHHQ